LAFHTGFIKYWNERLFCTSVCDGSEIYRKYCTVPFSKD
jgi:hypothetical protein